MGTKARSLHDRFVAKYEVDAQTGCWIWKGANVRGYGVIGVGGRGTGNVLAHRLSYELHVGPVPSDKCVLHRCDNPPCVNPAHLWLGTYADNNRDMSLKGRHFSKTRPAQVPRGERHGSARLTWALVREIRARSVRGERNASLARAFGVTRQNIRHIVLHKTWKEPAKRAGQEEK